MSIDVSTTGTYRNYRALTTRAHLAIEKKETAQTTRSHEVEEKYSYEASLKKISVKRHKKMLENLRGSRNDMDFMVLICK